MECVHISRDETMKEFKVKNMNNIIKILLKNSICHGSGNISELYNWLFDDIIVKCYGWHDGDIGFQNKHVLPPGGASNFLEQDSSEINLYGDIFIIRIKNDKLINTSVSDYGEFYNLISSNYSDNEENTDDDSESIFSDINSNDTDEEFEIINTNEEGEELEKDMNNY